MSEEDEHTFTTQEIVVLKKIAKKRIAWGEVLGDFRWLLAYAAAFIAGIVALKDQLLAALGLK